MRVEISASCFHSAIVDILFLEAQISFVHSYPAESMPCLNNEYWRAPNITHRNLNKGSFNFECKNRLSFCNHASQRPISQIQNVCTSGLNSPLYVKSEILVVSVLYESCFYGSQVVREFISNPVSNQKRLIGSPDQEMSAPALQADWI